MTPLICSVLAVSIGAEPPAGPPRDAKPEYGFSLTAKEAAEGWISLFDGKTTFGWTDATIKEGVLVDGATTSDFARVEITADVVDPGLIRTSGRLFKVAPGTVNMQLAGRTAGPIKLAGGASIRKLLVRPLDLEKKFNGKELTGWKVLNHPKLAANKAPKWTVANGVVRAVGGPGAIELQKRYGDFVLQVEVRTTKMANGGVFVRADPGSFMNGYEAQVFNACYDGNPAKPCRYSTGAIDDRQLARRLVSRDGEWFTMTVIASGPHLATWVNGYQMTDWTDTRLKDANPRKGLRLEAGTIQLQAHDPATDVEFRNLRIREMERRR